MEEDNEINNISIEDINNEFDKYQEDLSIREKKLKYLTRISIDDDFFKLVDEVCGSNLSEIKII